MCIGMCVDVEVRGQLMEVGTWDQTEVINLCGRSLHTDLFVVVTLCFWSLLPIQAPRSNLVHQVIHIAIVC